MVFNSDALPGHDAGAVKAVCEEKGFGGGEGRGKSNRKASKNGGFLRFNWKNDANCGLNSKKF
jgi:hypothetical protein